MKNFGKFANIMLIMLIGALAWFTLGADPVLGMTLAMAPPVGFGDLLHADGSDNIGGTQMIAYYAPIDDVLTLPGYKTAPSAMGDYATIDTDIVMKPGKKMLKLYATMDTGKVDDKKIEGKDNNAFESTYDFSFPKINAEALGFSRIAAATKCLVLVPEIEGNVRVLGILPGAPAIISDITITTGMVSTSDKSAKFQFKSWQYGPAPVYTGSIPLVEAEASSSV